MLTSLFTFSLFNIRLLAEKASRYTRIDYKHLKSLSRLVIVNMFGSLVEIFEENWFSKRAKFLDGKSVNELIHLFSNFEFLNPRCTKSIQYIGLKFLGTVNHAMPCQHSEQMFL